jgi:hypothetical protein
VGLTNMSVDNVLNGLLERDFRDFARVGSLKAIAKPLLPFTATGTGGDAASAQRGDHSDMKELQEMLQGALDQTEREAVMATLAQLRAGSAPSLSEASIVGTTCQSAAKMVLDTVCTDGRPSIVLMDECSQMLEPMAMVALSRFRGSRLVAVGDPQQLPPMLSGGCVETQGVEEQGLGRPLFTRLARVLHPVMLRTQYRCHPTIAAAVNGLFYGEGAFPDTPPCIEVHTVYIFMAYSYWEGCLETLTIGGRILDAPGLAERPPRFAPLPPAVFIDTASEGINTEQVFSEQQTGGGSFINDGEAQVSATQVHFACSTTILQN